MSLSGLSGLSGIYSSANLLSANLLAEYRLDEGSGQIVRNRVNASAPQTNLFQGAEQLFSKTIWSKSQTTATDYAGTDPLGNNNASRLVGTAGASRWLLQTVTLGSGAHTMSVWVKSNTGVSQDFRMSLDNGSTHTTFTATTSWQRFSITGTPGAGTTGRLLVRNDASSNAIDVLIYGALLETGSSASTYAAQTLDATLGSTGAADSNDPTWNTGYLGMQGSTYAIAVQSVPTTLTAMSAYAVVRWTGSEVLAGYAGILNEDFFSNLFHMAGDVLGNGPSARFSSAQITAYLANFQDSAWHVVALTYDGATLRFYLDGTEIGSASGSSLSISLRQLYIGAINLVGYWPGDQAYSMVYSAAHTKSQVQAQSATFRTLMGARSITLNTITKFVAVEGDSITDPTTAVNKGYAYLALRAITPVTQARNFAVSGSTLTSMNNRTTTLDATYDASRTKNILTILIGRNDLANAGTSAAQFVADLKTYCLARKAVGWTILLGTILPSTLSGFNTKRNAANTAIYADTSFYDALCDFAADATMGTDAAASDTALYSDGTHPTATGQANLKTIYQTALSALL